MTDLATDIIRRFADRSLSLATCESITGGVLGALLTTVPGASDVYRGGLITYATDLKCRLAKVDEAHVKRHGVVDGGTALQMAMGARSCCDADWAIATTGVAGPATQEGQDVGTVWIAVAGPGADDGMDQHSEQFHFKGDREEIRAQTAEQAFRMLLRVTDQK